MKIFIKILNTFEFVEWLYIYHASVLEYTDEIISKFFYKALFAIGMKDWGMDKTTSYRIRG